MTQTISAAMSINGHWTQKTILVICGNVDQCPYDRENDRDNEETCANKEVCPDDPLNDIDKDVCGDVDSC